jgi:hypothetical protein
LVLTGIETWSLVQHQVAARGGFLLVQKNLFGAHSSTMKTQQPILEGVLYSARLAHLGQTFFHNFGFDDLRRRFGERWAPRTEI